MSATPPNILFFQVDQLSARFLRSYGDPVCHAPNLDALAARGTVFDTAYCNFPLCSPSRASMAAGRLASRIGAYDNAAEFAAGVPTYAHYLRRAGYDTALSGKMHFIGPDQHHGFARRLTPDLYPADFSWVPNWGNEGKRDTNDARSITISGICADSKQITFDTEVAQAAQQFLYDHAAGGTQPFFLQVSFTHPHEPYLCLQEYWDLYADADIPLLAVPRLAEYQHDAHSLRLLTDFGLLNPDISDADVARARRAYYGAISYIDALIGQVLSALDRAGLSETTAIVFTSDHGDFLGERGMWFKKHFFDPSLQVPLILAGPGVPAGARVATPASLVDLLPTFLAWAGAEAPEDADGADLLTIAAAPPDTNRVIHAEYLAEATTAPIVMVREGPWKLIWSEDDPPLLFNLDSDPKECTNLASHADGAAPLTRLLQEVETQWDLPALKEAIVDSQRRRLIVRDAVSHGAKPRWNHGEATGETVRWYRGDGSYNDWAFDHLPAKPGQP